jgi:hypothetical protein
MEVTPEAKPKSPNLSCVQYKVELMFINVHLERERTFFILHSSFFINFFHSSLINDDKPHSVDIFYTGSDNGVGIYF